MKKLLVIILALSIATIMYDGAFAEKSTFFDSVKFIQYLDENIALEEVRNGNLDVYYYTTSLSHVSRIEGVDATPIAHTCIIGPDDDCLVKESTRKPGQIYDVVEVNGVVLNVRYSGPDVRLEKFSILPANTAFLPDATWNVEIIKDEQVSKFYYKITYKNLE